MPLYRVRDGYTFGVVNKKRGGDIVELSEKEASGFLDMLEPVDSSAGTEVVTHTTDVGTADTDNGENNEVSEISSDTSDTSLFPLTEEERLSYVVRFAWISDWLNARNPYWRYYKKNRDEIKNLLAHGEFSPEQAFIGELFTKKRVSLMEYFLDFMETDKARAFFNLYEELEKEWKQ